MKIKVVTLCSGYESQCMALDVIKEKHPQFDYDLIAWSEIDKYAILMHNLVYPQYADRNLGDMTKIDWTPIKEKYGEIDLLFYSTPCQSVSAAGRGDGFAEGSETRSAILWSTEEAIRILRPKYLLQENVKNIISGYPKLTKKDKEGNEVETFWSHLCKWMQRVEQYDYINDWSIINAKNMGVPQNRERFFLLSQRKDIAKHYEFPKPIPLTKKLEDVLEDEVEEKYFLKDDAVSKFLKANDKDSAVFVQFGLSPTHENAMFLKTWLTMAMDALKMWELTPTALEEEMGKLKPKFLEVFEHWKETGEFPGDAFEEAFRVNMERKVA